MFYKLALIAVVAIAAVVSAAPAMYLSLTTSTDSIVDLPVVVKSVASGMTGARRQSAA